MAAAMARPHTARTSPLGHLKRKARDENKPTSQYFFPSRKYIARMQNVIEGMSVIGWLAQKKNEEVVITSTDDKRPVSLLKTLDPKRKVEYANKIEKAMAKILEAKITSMPSFHNGPIRRDSPIGRIISMKPKCPAENKNLAMPMYTALSQ